MSKSPPSKTDMVIVGGGIAGCSLAYHLTKIGITDVVLLERKQLTCGTTWHAAGLVGQLRSSRNVTRMLKHSVELYESLEAETGQATGWKQVGGLRLACSEERMQELRKGATTARSFGLEMHMLSPQEALDLFPIMSPKDIVGGAFLPTDGYADPSSVTRALAKGARDGGVTIERGVRVEEFLLKDRRVTGVRTNRGDIEVETVLLAAGMVATLWMLAALQRRGPGDALVLAGMVGGPLLLVAFVLRQRRAVEPLFDLALFRVPGFGAGFALSIVMGAGLFATTYLTPLYFQQAAHMSPTAAGFMLLPAGIAMALVFPLAGHLSDGRASIAVIAMGLGLFIGATLCFGPCSSITAFADLDVDAIATGTVKCVPRPKLRTLPAWPSP